MFLCLFWSVSTILTAEEPKDISPQPPQSMARAWNCFSGDPVYAAAYWVKSSSIVTPGQSMCSGWPGPGVPETYRAHRQSEEVCIWMEGGTVFGVLGHGCPQMDKTLAHVPRPRKKWGSSFCGDPLFHMPNFSLPFALQLDASNRGLGAEPVGEGAQVQHGSVWQSSGWLPFLLLPPATLIHPLLRPRPAAMLHRMKDANLVISGLTAI